MRAVNAPHGPSEARQGAGKLSEEAESSAAQGKGGAGTAWGLRRSLYGLHPWR